MASQKVTDLTSAAVVDLADLIHLIDVSDTSGDPLGTSKKASIAQLKAAMGTGATDFIALTDTPASYTGAAKKTVRVNAAGTALEFATDAEFTTVGVNTASPGAQLHITSTAGTAPLRVDTHVSNNQLLIDDATGHAGLNTSAPTHRLHIKETLLGADDEAKNLISLVSEKRSGIRFLDLVSSIEYHSGRIVSYYEGISAGETGLRLQLANNTANSYIDVIRLRSLSTATGKKLALMRSEDFSAALGPYETALGNDMANNEMAFYMDGNDLKIQRKDNSATITNLTIGTLS